MRFWDASALVPLVVSQPATARADQWLRADRDVVVWTLTPVEIASALRRLVREGALDERRAAGAEALADEALARAHVVTDVERVKAIARRLLRVHSLRAADALQLGAALAWTDGAPEGRVLCCLDRRLADAAAREGFRVLPSPSE